MYKSKICLCYRTYLFFYLCKLEAFFCFRYSEQTREMKLYNEYVLIIIFFLFKLKLLEICLQLKKKRIHSIAHLCMYYRRIMDY
jgi:hypothetical protein